MSSLKQRVPLTVSGDLITTEWLKDLQRIDDQSSGVSGGGTSAATAALIANLTDEIAALKARVKKLETGYQA